jgi:polyvinyl alcohol dehydrogenase (cytochrome)
MRGHIVGRNHATAGGVRRAKLPRIALGAFLPVVVLIAFAVAAPSSAASSQPKETPATTPIANNTSNWTSYLHGPAHNSYNVGTTTISPSNVAQLAPVWQFTPSPQNNNGFLASPTVANGIVYIGSENGYFYAFNEATQAIVWSVFLGTVKGTTCGPGSLGIISTATVANDPGTGNLTVYVNGPDGYMYAIDAATGDVDWRSVVGIPSSTQNDYYAWGSPLVVNGNVYIGISSECDTPLVPAGLLEFNQQTGAQTAFWHALPNNQIGASIWSSPAMLSDGQIIVTTGNDMGNQQNLYADSIVRLSGSDLSVIGGWQIPVAQQTPDADFGASPTLFTASINGASTSMIGVCNKNGIYYAFSQASLRAGPVWEHTMGTSYTGGIGQCDSGAIWDGTHLIVGGGSTTTINGTSYQGSVQALNPATGVPVWQTGLAGEIIGTPTENGAGVIAAPVYESTTGNEGMYLLSASTGAILGFIPTNGSQNFGQGVWSGKDLLVPAGYGQGLTAYEVTKPGPAITGISPSVIGEGGTTTVTITGSGFSGSPRVIFPGNSVTVNSTTLISSTQVKASITVQPHAVTGPTNVEVVEPASRAVVDTCTGCFTIDQGPTATSASPNSLAPGTTGASVTLAGTGFQSGVYVTSVSGIPVSSTVFDSASQLGLTVTVKSTVAPGQYSFYVHNPDGGYTACYNCLTVT